MSFRGNYNTSVFGRLKCVVLRRLKCVIFGRFKSVIFGWLKYLIFMILKYFHFREFEICRPREIEMFHFREIELCHSGKICHFRDIQFSGDWNLSFREIKLVIFEKLKFRGLNMTFSGNWNVTFWEMKHLNCPVSRKLNFSFTSAEITRIRRSENLNLKQSVNQSTPEVPMLTGFVMR